MRRRVICLILRPYVNGNLAESYIVVDPRDERDLDNIKKIFNEQKKRGIHTGEYDDDEWCICRNNDRKFRILFSDILEWPKSYSKEEYINIVKSFIIKNLEETITDQVRNYASLIIRIGNESTGWKTMVTRRLSVGEIDIIRNFLEELEDVQIEELLVGFKPIDIEKRNNQRNLATDAWTYYVFDDEIKKFWVEASEEEKIVYAPLYLYWRICSVIPTRPTEFTYLPFDCLEYSDGKYYLSMHNSLLKGTKKRLPRNTVADDYELVQYSIPEDIAQTIQWYQKVIFPHIQKNTSEEVRLFNNTLYSIITKKRCENTFRRAHLQQLIANFTVDILQNRKGYQILDLDGYEENTSRLNRKWTSIWRPGDLRIISMIDMVVRGVDPAIIMHLAGHTDIETACHYYTNITPITTTRLHYLRSHQEVEIKGDSLPRTQIRKRKNVFGGVCTHPDERPKICVNYSSHIGCRFFSVEDENDIKKWREEIGKETTVLFKSYIEYVKSCQPETAKIVLAKAQTKLMELQKLEENYLYEG